MTPEQFCYWLQGAFETMDEGRDLSSFDQTIRDHLKTVFHKVTPTYNSPIYERNKDSAPYRPDIDPFAPNKIIC